MYALLNTWNSIEFFKLFLLKIQNTSTKVRQVEIGETHKNTQIKDHKWVIKILGFAYMLRNFSMGSINVTPSY
jgi:hypothetical protein